MSAQYKVGDLVMTCDNDIMVVDEVRFIGEYFITLEMDRDDPINYDYLLMTKEREDGDEYWYSHDQIEHKVNHFKEVTNDL